MSHYFEADNNLKDKPKLIPYQLEEQRFLFKTNSGIFSKNEVDFGSELLVKTFLENYKQGNILDLGCGYGYIGIVLKRFLKTDIDMVDINENAVFICKNNIESNRVKCNVKVSDGFEMVNNKYDYIISNPPIRVGKNKLYELLFTALTFLKENGELWLVVRKEQGAKSLVKDLNIKYRAEIVDKKSGFYIIKAYIA